MTWNFGCFRLIALPLRCSHKLNDYSIYEQETIVFAQWSNENGVETAVGSKNQIEGLLNTQTQLQSSAVFLFSVKGKCLSFVSPGQMFGQIQKYILWAQHKCCFQYILVLH